MRAAHLPAGIANSASCVQAVRDPLRAMKNRQTAICPQAAPQSQWQYVLSTGFGAEETLSTQARQKGFLPVFCYGFFEPCGFF